MRKLFTLSIALGCLFCTAVKSYGQAAGDFVFVQAATTDSLWATQANWKISDGNGGYSGDATSLPGATNNVWIASGSKMGTIVSSITNSACTVTAGSTTVTLTTGNTNIKAGMAVRNSDNFYGIAPGTYVTNVSSDGVTVTLSQAATRNLTKLSYFTACKNLNVNGTFRISAQFVTFGDITVNSTGTIFQNSDLYCKNITNYGNYIGLGGYRSAKNLYFGFEGAIPGTGNYTLTNDGTFGDTAPILPQGSRAGVRFLYSNQSNSVTIKPSQPGITTGKINIAQMLPHSNMLTTANTTLNIKQSMSLLIHNGIGLSIQNNDSCLNTIRTCNIDPGVTVYVGYNFHANRNVTTNPQGSFVYNVLGTLDLGTWATATNSTPPTTATTDFGLCMSNVAGNAGTLTFNLGDGTLANAGTLVLGSNIKMIKLSTQTINFNIKDYSTVVYTGNYNQAINYQLLNDNVPALYLLPSKYYNLTYNGAKVMLPIKPKYSGTFTNTANGYGTANWVARASGATPTTISTSLYTATLAQGSIMYTGTGYYYVPVVRATYDLAASSDASPTKTITRTLPLSANDTIASLITARQYANGANIPSNDSVVSVTPNSITINARTTNSAAASNVVVTFTGIQGTTMPTGTGTVLNPTFDGQQPLIYLGDATLAGATFVTSINDISTNSVRVYSQNKQLVITNAQAGDMVAVYNISGIRVTSQRLTSDNAAINLAQGVYIVKVNDSVAKVIVK